MKKIIKLLLEFIFLLIFMFLFSGNVKAATVSLSVNKTSVEVGDTIKVTVNVTAAQWKLDIIADGTTISSSSELDNYKSNITKSFSGSYKATKEGSVTFKLSGDITDVNQTNSSINETKTVTVKAKSSSGGSSSNTSSSGSGSSSSSSSTGTTKPQEPSFTTVNETVYATSSVNVRSSYSTSSSVIGSLNKGDSVTRIGKGSNGWSKVKYNNKTAYISSSYLSTEKPEESNEKNLKSLTIDGDYKLTPEFDKNVTEYTLSVGSDVESIKINAKAVDNNAKVEIKGNDKLLMGENTVEIKVTAEDGTVRTYKINVTRGEETVSADFGLSELSVERIYFNSKF